MGIDALKLGNPLNNKKNNPLEKWIDTVQPIDCIEGMQQLPDKCVDLIVADPPYNLSKGNKWSWNNKVKLPGFGGEWKKVMEKWDNLSLSDYWNFTATWISETKRLLKPTGSLWVFGTYHNVGIINTLFQILEIEIINEIIWYKRNAFPNLSGRRFTASHENFLWAHVGGKKRRYLFNYKEMKNAMFPEEPTKKAGKQMRTVWNIPNNKSKKEIQFGKHPTQKPLTIANRVILSSSNIGDICLIPFAGAGTECVSAKQHGRKFIAFEIDEKYVNITRSRLEDLAKQSIQKKIGEFDIK